MRLLATRTDRLRLVGVITPDSGNRRASAASPGSPGTPRRSETTPERQRRTRDSRPRSSAMPATLHQPTALRWRTHIVKCCVSGNETRQPAPGPVARTDPDAGRLRRTRSNNNTSRRSPRSTPPEKRTPTSTSSQRYTTSSDLTAQCADPSSLEHPAATTRTITLVVARSRAAQSDWRPNACSAAGAASGDLVGPASGRAAAPPIKQHGTRAIPASGAHETEQWACRER
jgi:hypothetical protein